ncbi:phage major capsid family protein [Microbacterium enclense]|uniref:phage major capsid family protein n=1 Tax=Microbacterium enclense TaxID=993073 RepID=UPI003F7E1129
MRTVAEIKADMRTALEAAKAISQKAIAENRDMTNDEVGIVSTHLKTIEAAKSELAEVTNQTQVKAALDSLRDDPTGTPGLGQAKSIGEAWSAKAVHLLQKSGLVRSGVEVDGGTQVKAFLSGTVAVPNLLDAGKAVPITARRRTLLDLIGRGEPGTRGAGNQFGWLAQTARTNNAAPILDGRNKPSNVYTFAENIDTYRTFVSKSEKMPYRYTADYSTLIDELRRQLAEDMQVAIEKSALTGTGPDTTAGTDNFIGILNTSGIQAQAYTTSLLQTLSNAKYKYIAAELPINGWVFNPTDLQALELLRENGTTGPFMFQTRAALEDWLGAPLVTTVGMAAGKALVGDFTQAELIPLGDDELVIDTSQRIVDNTFQMMDEGRYGFRVKKALAFCQVSLA